MYSSWRGGAVKALFILISGTQASSVAASLSSQETFTAPSVSPSHSQNESSWAAPELPGQVVPAQWQVKPLAIGRQDLLFQNYTRAGSATEIVDPVSGYRVNLFSYQSEPSTNYRGGVFSQQSGESNYGALMSYNLFGGWQLSAGYIGESEKREPLLTDIDSEGYGAKSWNAVVIGRWLGESVTSHLEYARSEYSDNQYDPNAEAWHGQALQAQLRLSSDGVFSAGWMDYWAGQFSYRSVGRHFYSPGNGSLSPGRDLARVHFETAALGLGMELEWRQESDNDELEAITLAPVIERSGVRFNYKLSDLLHADFLWNSLGTPLLTARYYRVGTKEQDQLVFDRGYEIYDEADEMGVKMVFSHDRWNWSVDYQLTDKDLEVQQLSYLDQNVSKPSDQLQQAATFRLGWLPSKRLAFNVNAQWFQRNELEDDSTFESQNYGLEANIQMMPQTLSVLMRYNYGYQYLEQVQLDLRELNKRTYFGDARVSWHARRSLGDRPGIDVYLKSTYGRQLNRIQYLTEDQWSGHLGF